MNTRQPKSFVWLPSPTSLGLVPRGITLLEVLIAIGVMAVGLLGLASLLPVARFFMQDGSKYDHTAALGQQAIHYLESRSDLLNPKEWHAPAGNGNFVQVCPPSVTVTYPDGSTFPCDNAYNYEWPNLSPIATIPPAPFVLDPLLCAYPPNLSANGTTGAASGTGQLGLAGNFAPTFFPPSGYSLDSPGGVGSIGSPAIARVTVPRTGGFALAGSRPMFTAPMSFAAAQQIFASTDDPVFELPSDPTQRPFVQLPLANTSPSQWSKVQGDYSWFAVIDNMQKPWSPGPDKAWGVATSDDNSDGIVDNLSEAGWPGSDDVALWQESGGELWDVSVVVVYKRNLQLIPTAASDIPPERMCYCDFLSAPLPVNPANAQDAATIQNAGLGGGDCVLFVPSSLAPSEEWLNVKPHQWIMLSGWLNANTSITAPVRSQLGSIQWFRILSVGEIVAQTDSSGNVTGWERAVTLAGSDMNPYKFVDATGAPGGNQSLYATIVDGVTGVFEATIEQGQK